MSYPDGGRAEQTDRSEVREVGHDGVLLRAKDAIGLAVDSSEPTAIGAQRVDQSSSANGIAALDHEDSKCVDAKRKAPPIETQGMVSLSESGYRREKRNEGKAHELRADGQLFHEPELLSV